MVCRSCTVRVGACTTMAASHNLQNSRILLQAWRARLRQALSHLSCQVKCLGINPTRLTL